MSEAIGKRMCENATNKKIFVVGALHADGSEYVKFARSFHPEGIRLEDADRIVMNNLCTAFTNFARTSNPNPLSNGDEVKWNQHTHNEHSYMQFNENCSPIKGKIWKEGVEFWKQIFDTYVDWSHHKNRRLQL